jgi:hypothetical protein
MRSPVKIAHRVVCLAAATALTLGSAVASPADGALFKETPLTVEGSSDGNRPVLLLVSSQNGRVRTMKWVCVRCADTSSAIAPAARMRTAPKAPSTGQGGLGTR